MLRSKLLYLLSNAFLVFLLFGFTSCKTKKILEQSPLKSLNETALIQEVKNNNFEFDNLSGKFNASIQSEFQNGSFKVNLRMKKDSAIWLSITPALGIEVARVLITQDTVKFIDKLHNKYYVGDYSILNKLMQSELSFNFIQNVLVGNAVEISDEEKYVSLTEGLYYVLVSKTNKKVKKALNSDPQESYKSSTDSLFQSDEKKLRKARKKLPEDELIVKKYWISPENYQIEKILIDDISEERTVTILYNDFTDIENQKFPQNSSVLLKTPQESASFELNYSRVRIDESQTFPFKVPSSYEPYQ